MMRNMVLVILIICADQVLIAQSETYTIKEALFSSDKYDEFSPVYYNKGIVFCTNRNSTILNRSTTENKGLFKIYYIDTTIIADWKSATLFSKTLQLLLMMDLLLLIKIEIPYFIQGIWKLIITNRYLRSS